jgi:hypothetical protein
LADQPTHFSGKPVIRPAFRNREEHLLPDVRPDVADAEPAGTAIVPHRTARENGIADLSRDELPIFSTDAPSPSRATRVAARRLD